MKSALVSFAVLGSASALQPVLDGSVSLDEEFDIWAKHYGKTYSSSDHRAARKAIYAHARAFVIDHNQVGFLSCAPTTLLYWILRSPNLTLENLTLFLFLPLCFARLGGNAGLYRRQALVQSRAQR